MSSQQASRTLSFSDFRFPSFSTQDPSSRHQGPARHSSVRNNHHAGCGAGSLYVGVGGLFPATSPQEGRSPSAFKRLRWSVPVPRRTGDQLHDQIQRLRLQVPARRGVRQSRWHLQHPFHPRRPRRRNPDGYNK